MPWDSPTGSSKWSRPASPPSPVPPPRGASAPGGLRKAPRLPAAGHRISFRALFPGLPWIFGLL
jgi:hypothetical protein